jgi:hypothetical protein
VEVLATWLSPRTQSWENNHNNTTLSTSLSKLLHLLAPRTTTSTGSRISSKVLIWFKIKQIQQVITFLQRTKGDLEGNELHQMSAEKDSKRFNPAISLMRHNNRLKARKTCNSKGLSRIEAIWSNLMTQLVP